MPVPRGHTDTFEDLSLSTTHIALLHRDVSYVSDGKFSYRVANGLELRAGSHGRPLSSVLRCDNSQFDGTSSSFDLDGSTLAYGPADCSPAEPVSIVVRDLASDAVALRLVQPVGARVITDVRLAGRYLGFIRHFGSPSSSATGSEVVVVDRQNGAEVLVLRRGRELPDTPLGFAMQADGKVAVAFYSPGQPGGLPARLAWASPSDPVRLLPGSPSGLGRYGLDNIAMAGDRIAFPYADDDSCSNGLNDRYSIAVSDLSGKIGRVGPAGYLGRLTVGGFNGRLVTWVRGASDGSVLFQDLVQEPLEARRSPPCKRYVATLARLAAPRQGAVSARGRLRLRGACLDRSGATERASQCNRWIFLRRPGRSLCRRYGRAPPSRFLVGRRRELSLEPGRSRAVTVPLRPRTLARLKRGGSVSAVAEWCSYSQIVEGPDPIASVRVRLRLGRR